MYTDYLYKEEPKSFDLFPGVKKYKKYKSSSKKKRKDVFNKSNAVTTVLDHRKNMMETKKSFSQFDKSVKVLSKSCEEIVKTYDFLKNLILLAGLSLFGIVTYLKEKDKIKEEVASLTETVTDTVTDAAEKVSEKISTVFPETPEGKMSKEGRDQLKSDEGGFRATAYWDVNGYSIGYGHHGLVNGKPIRKGQTVTKEEAERLFEKDVAKAEKQVNNYLRTIKTPVSQKQFDAMVNYTYNAGSLGPKFKAKLKAGDYSGAAEELEVGEQNKKRMAQIRETFKADITKDNKLKGGVKIINPPKVKTSKASKTTKTKATPAGKFEQYDNYTKVGGYTLVNPSTKRHFIELSKRAKLYIEETGGKGIITSGAEGDHASGEISHATGNKIDVQGMKGAKTTDEEYAILCINFLKNPNTAYINLESFYKNEVKNIVKYIEDHDAKAFELSKKYTPYTPGPATWFGKNKLLCSLSRGRHWERHLDIGILPDSYFKTSYKESSPKVATKMNNQKQTLAKQETKEKEKKENQTNKPKVIPEQKSNPLKNSSPSAFKPSPKNNNIKTQDTGSIDILQQEYSKNQSLKNKGR